MGDWSWIVSGRDVGGRSGWYPPAEPTRVMNHQVHYRKHPRSIPRPGDERVARVLVWKDDEHVIDMGSWHYSMPGYWKVYLQERNSPSNNWTTVQKHRFDEFENAITFAAIFNRKRD